MTDRFSELTRFIPEINIDPEVKRKTGTALRWVVGGSLLISVVVLVATCDYEKSASDFLAPEKYQPPRSIVPGIQIESNFAFR